MSKINEENNFIYLCFSLVFLLFSGSVVEEFPDTWGDTLFSLVTIFMFSMSIFTLYTNMTWRRVIYVLISLTVILFAIERFFDFHYFKYVNLLILLIFFLYSFLVAYRQIIFKREVNTNIIIGSLSLYLLLGLIWTIIYLFLLQIDPTALSGGEESTWNKSFF